MREGHPPVLAERSVEAFLCALRIGSFPLVELGVNSDPASPAYNRVYLLLRSVSTRIPQ